jgi:hypothetical protein
MNDSISTPATTTTTCVPCAHAAEHHWWGPQLEPAKSHCDRCHRSWASGRECHCSVCCRHFDHINAFDAHQLDGACHDPSELRRRDGSDRFEEITRTFGKVWRIRPTRPNRFLASRN